MLADAVSRLRKLFSPSFYVRELQIIDNESPSYELDRTQSMQRIALIALVVCISLFLIHYLKGGKAFIGLMRLANPEWESSYRSSYYGELFFYTWWTFWQLIGYIVLPLIAIKFVLPRQKWELGLVWGDTSKHTRYYLALVLPILCFVVIASFSESFTDHYPFYNKANRSLFDFIAWECLYILQFFALEFFFRGFVTQGLRPALGANAIWFMMIPYMMIHLPKLWPETFGAILFGFFLGLLALKSRSIWGGFFVHVSIALAMDLTAL